MTVDNKKVTQAADALFEKYGPLGIHAEDIARTVLEAAEAPDVPEDAPTIHEASDEAGIELLEIDDPKPKTAPTAAKK